MNGRLKKPHPKDEDVFKKREGEKEKREGKFIFCKGDE